MADVLSPLLTETPPRLGSKQPGDLLEQAKLAWQARSWDVRALANITRLFTSSIATSWKTSSSPTRCAARCR